MAEQLPVGYWESLGQNGPFLWLLFMSQQEQVQQLWETNTFLQARVADTRDDITNVASATVSAVTQAITTNPQANTPTQSQSQSGRSVKAAKPESFYGN